MGDKNIKIVKVDPTGFFVKKDEEDEASIDSEITDESSVTSEISEPENENINLNPLPSAPKAVSVIKEPEVMQSSIIKIDNASDVANINSYLSVKKEEPEIPFTNNTVSEETVTSESSAQSKNETISDTDTDSDEQVIDMDDNTLYTALAALLEDEDGDNVSDNLKNINRHLEKHNETMEKILNEYSEINKERARERKYMEQLSIAINNQNRMMERLVNVFDVFLKSSGVKTKEIENEDNDMLGGLEEKNVRTDKISRRIETPENTGKHRSTVKVFKK